MTFDLLVKPVLYRLQGLLPAERPTVQAFLTQKVYSPMGEDEFLRVLVGQVGERLVATPLQRRGWGDHVAGAGRRHRAPAAL